MRGRWLTVMFVSAVFVASGCSGGDDAATDASEAAPPAAAGDRDTSARGATGAGELVGVARELVSTADLTVVAKDVEEASAAAEAAVTERGGFVFGQEDAFEGEDQAVLTLKVPPKDFRGLLVALADLGKVEQRSVTTDDVTAAGADLDARILSAQKSVDRVRGFLDQTKNVTELAGLEAELTRRESDLEQLVGQRRVLDDQVSLATVTLRLSSTPAPPPPVGDSLRSVPGFGGALASGVGALVKIGRVVGAGVGYALPFAVVLGVPMLAVRALRRRRRDGASPGPMGPTPSLTDSPSPPPVAPIA